jgi:hypothetical protein
LSQIVVTGQRTQDPKRPILGQAELLADDAHRAFGGVVGKKMIEDMQRRLQYGNIVGAGMGTHDR